MASISIATQGVKYCVSVFKGSKLFVSAESDDEQAAIDKAAQKLVEKGLPWDGIPVAMGMVLKERPRFAVGEFLVVLNQM